MEQGCGCPYSHWNREQECEVCKLTGEPTNFAMKCDFGYDEECETYKTNLKKDS